MNKKIEKLDHGEKLSFQIHFEILIVDLGSWRQKIRSRLWRKTSRGSPLRSREVSLSSQPQIRRPTNKNSLYRMYSFCAI